MWHQTWSPDVRRYQIYRRANCREQELEIQPHLCHPVAAPTNTSQPNGLRLVLDPFAAVEKAIAPVGTYTVPSGAEIGRTAVTPDEVEETLNSLIANPVIPVAGQEGQWMRSIW